MKKALIFGANGLLGQSLLKRFAGSYQIIAASLEDHLYPDWPDCEYHQIDIANRLRMQELLESTRPDLIINAAAYTDVDKSEEERELCWNVNVRGVENIVESGLAGQTILVHISTDYIFDGEDPPYREIDHPNPYGNYARSKMASENIVKASGFEYIIARSQILYGTGNKVRLNFATWVIDQLKKEKKIRVVSDQIGNPTYAPDLSEAIFRLLEKECYGLYHIAGQESISRYDFARKIAAHFNLNADLIEKISTEELNQKVPRPRNSTFVLDKLFNRIHWLPHNVDDGLELLKKELE
mgnify:CR=1 FL=1